MLRRDECCVLGFGPACLSLGMRDGLVCEGKMSCDAEVGRTRTIIVQMIGVVLSLCTLSVHVPVQLPGRFQKEDLARNSNLRPSLDQKDWFTEGLI